MAAPSELIKQHIGSIESQLTEVYKEPGYASLAQFGFEIADGVYAIHRGFRCKFTPRGCEFNIASSELLPGDVATVTKWYTLYCNIISTIDKKLVNDLYDLHQRRKELEEALVREQQYPGGQLWWVSQYGIFHIEFLSFKNDMATFNILNDANKKDKPRTRNIKQMRLFLTEKEARFTKEVKE